MSKGNLLEFIKELGIKRINFDEIEPSECDEQYADDKLICPYCETEIEYLGEETDTILKGVTYQCPDCEKWFRVEAEVTISTTCTPLENHLLEPWIRREIEATYKHDDECNEKGLIWDVNKKYSYVEWKTYKEYAEPLFENQKIDEVKE